MRRLGTRSLSSVGPHGIGAVQRPRSLSDCTRLARLPPPYASPLERRDAKAGCKLKAEEWSERTHLRTMELQGVAEAIRILTSEDSRDTFQNAVTTLVQVSSKRSLGAACARLGSPS